MRPRLRPRPNDLASRPHGPRGLNIPGNTLLGVPIFSGIPSLQGVHRRLSSLLASADDMAERRCKDRSQYKCFQYLLTKLSNSIDVFVIFRWSFTLAVFETIAETTQEILEN